jgi:polysaccharide biosynthesis transport protein
LGNELHSMARYARQWWWLLVAAVIIGASFGFLAASRQQSLYASTAQMVISPTAGDTSIDNGTVEGAQSLASTYQQLITTWPVLEPVVKSLDLPYGVDELRSKLTAEVVPSTLILTITASDDDPEQSAQLANAVAQQFQNYLTLQSRSAKVDLVIAVPAIPPSSSYAPRVPLYVALGAFVGLLATSGFLAVRSFMDKSIKTPAEAVSLVQKPILAVLPYDQRIKRGPANYIPLISDSSDAFAEAVRHLRTRVLYSRSSFKELTLAILSPHKDEGKTTVVANLAVAIAHSGFSVTIIDADLRSPSLHERFGVINDRGLSTLIIHPEQSWHSVAANMRVTNLSFIPSGPVVPDAIDFLDGGRLRPIVSDISDVTDVVLIDTPSLLDFSDGIAIAKEADAAVLVCRIGKTSSDDLQTAAAVLEDAGVWVAGIVMNNQRSVKWDPVLPQISEEHVPELADRSVITEEPSIESLFPR